MPRVVCLLLLFAGGLAAQSSGWGNPPPASIASAGYSMPRNLIQAAPGQVVSLMVYGLAYKQDVPFVASGFPLPTTLGGISVTLQQVNNAFPVPLLSVRQVCSPVPCQPLTVVTVQIPFEAIAHCVPCAIASIPGVLQVSQTGGATASVQVDLIPDVMHVTGMCDTTANPFASGGTCARLVTHADGTIVDGFHPATPGEELVMYLLGMGRTDPPLKTGLATPNPPPSFAAEAFGLNLDFRLNAPPSRPGASLNVPPAVNVPHPVYAGAVPGFAALYQVNFVVPAAGLDLSLRCAGTSDTNLTVTVYSINSYDGSGICVLGPAKD
jgi:uncharacterized protein (TIGR03437 family)